MRKLSYAFAAAVLAASFALPVNAAPIFVPIPEQVKQGLSSRSTIGAIVIGARSATGTGDMLRAPAAITAGVILGITGTTAIGTITATIPGRA